MAAIYHAEIPVDLAGASRERPLPVQFFRGDNDSHIFTAWVGDSANPEAGLLAGTVAGTALRPDGVTVPLAGEKGSATVPVIFDGITVQATPCRVTLPQAAFRIPGMIKVSILLTDGGITTTVLSLSGSVVQTNTDAVADPEELIPNLPALQTAAAQAIAAAGAAETAAESVPALVAPTFDTTTAYAAGDYVYYNGSIYRFTAAHAAGAWTGSDAVAVTVTGEFSDLKSHIVEQSEDPPTSPNNRIWFPSATPEGVEVPTWAEHEELKSAVKPNEYDSPAEIWELGQIGYSSGSESGTTTNSRMRTAGYISDLVAKISTEVGYLALYAWNGGTYVGVWTGSAFATDNNYTHGTIDIASIRENPSYSAYKFRIVYYESSSHSIDIATDSANVIFCGAIADELQKINVSLTNITDDITDLNNDVDDIKSNDTVFTGAVLIEIGEYTNNQYVKKNGEFNNFTGWHRSGYVEIGEHERFIRFANSGNVTEEYNCFYDGDYNKVGDSFDTNNTTVEIPVTAKYFAVSLENTYTVTATKLFNPLTKKANKKDLYCRDAYKYKIPEYWLDDATNKTMYLSDKIDAINAYRHDTALAFITDVHWEKNAKKSQYILPYMASVIGVDAVINGGDNIHQQPTTADAEYVYRQFSDYIRDAFKYNYRFVYGNHDLNTANAGTMYPSTPVDDLRLTYMFNYKHSIMPWASELQFEPLKTDVEEYAAWNRMHYYWDDTICRIRYICVNTGNTYQPVSQYIQNASGLAELYVQLPFVYNAIMSLPDGWSVMVFGHQLFNDGSLEPTPPARSLARLLNAIETKSICTLGGNASTYISGTMDCTNAPNVNIIGMMCGHDHSDGSVVFTGHDTSSSFAEGTDASSDDSVLIIKSNTDGYRVEYGVPMSLGDTTEQSFDIVCINLLNKTMKTVRIGAGSDRTFNY